MGGTSEHADTPASRRKPAPATCPARRPGREAHHAPHDGSQGPACHRCADRRTIRFNEATNFRDRQKPCASRLSLSRTSGEGSLPERRGRQPPHQAALRSAPAPAVRRTPAWPAKLTKACLGPRLPAPPAAARGPHHEGPQITRERHAAMGCDCPAGDPGLHHFRVRLPRLPDLWLMQPGLRAGRPARAGGTEMSVHGRARVSAPWPRPRGAGARCARPAPAPRRPRSP